ncbi:MAG: ABC transporter permease subunit [Planctomycetaceae bacterium]|nr:MAG: ABC transporter permease subunit [Planctomycetaceae bacterium]
MEMGEREGRSLAGLVRDAGLCFPGGRHCDVRHISCLQTCRFHRNKSQAGTHQDTRRGGNHDGDNMPGIHAVPRIRKVGCFCFGGFAMRTAANNPVRGWRDRIFSAATFFFVSVFIVFVLGLILTDVFYVDKKAVVTVLTSKFILHALWMSIWTSFVTTFIALLFAVPMGYALSRFRFPGRIMAEAVVDLPIVFPPLVVGLTLLVFFSQTAVGRWIQDDLGLEFVFQPKGIVLCQFFAAASFAIRSAKTAFDDVDRRYENVALTLGCTQWGSFRRVSLPLARNGIIAGGILTWARAFGLFGPLMIFVGSFRGRTEVLSTTIFLEQSVGNLEVALAIALLLILVALIAVTAIRLVGGSALVKL